MAKLPGLSATGYNYNAWIQPIQRASSGCLLPVAQFRYPPAMTISFNRRQLLASLGASAVAGKSFSAADLPISSRELWGWVRAQQVLDPSMTYLDTASIGPGLRSALATEYRQQELFNSDVESYQRSFLSPTPLSALMKRLGGLLGCQLDELTITRGAGEALNLVANGLQLAAGDEVVVAAHSHASAVYPWILQAQRRGIVVKQVAFPIPLQGAEQPLGLIAGAVTDKTRVIAFSHLQHTDGAVLPVNEICAFARQRSILTVVDGAQACGSTDINVTGMGCDFYAASLHKWINGPHGFGLLYIRKPLLNALAPSVADSNLGWEVINRYGQASIDDETQRATWPTTLGKFGASLRFLGPQLKALEATLDFRDQLGKERIEARIRELAIYARLRMQSMSDFEILTPAGPGLWAGILSIRPKRMTSQELTQRLRRSNKIVVSAIAQPAYSILPAERIPEFSCVRMSLHIFNSHDDVERLVRALT